MSGQSRSRELVVEDSVDIDALPGDLYEWVSDVTRMGEWSPENRGSTGTPGAEAYPGMTFEGRNTRGRASWVTRCTVTAAEPGRRFEFRVHAIGVKSPRINAPIATWEYRFEPLSGSGTRVTEKWTDDRSGWPDPVARAFDAVVTGGKTFAEFQRGNIARTLRNLKDAAEN